MHGIARRLRTATFVLALGITLACSVASSSAGLIHESDGFGDDHVVVNAVATVSLTGPPTGS